MLKDNAEIANLVSRLLMRYANRVENGAVNAYQGLLSGDSAKVVLTVSVHGAISDEPYIEPAVISIPQATEPEIEGSTDDVVWSSPILEEKVTEETVVVEEKPKRKRKK